jgi:uncharacterized surface protein with fasciclin (FAS1) repeats
VVAEAHRAILGAGAGRVHAAFIGVSTVATQISMRLTRIARLLHVPPGRLHRRALRRVPPTHRNPAMKSTFLAVAITLSLAAVPAFAGDYGAKTEKTAGTIVDVAAGNPDFSTLVAAVKAAGLVDTLNGTGPFTVFAPTNAAFAKLPAGTVESLLLPENKDKLTAILTYHVVPGAVKAADVAGLTQATTVNGKVAKIDTSMGVKIGDANVVSTDILASNGVIHVIDTVLIP